MKERVPNTITIGVNVGQRQDPSAVLAEAMVGGHLDADR